MEAEEPAGACQYLVWIITCCWAHGENDFHSIGTKNNIGDHIQNTQVHITSLNCAVCAI